MTRDNSFYIDAIESAKKGWFKSSAAKLVTAPTTEDTDDCINEALGLSGTRELCEDLEDWKRNEIRAAVYRGLNRWKAGLFFDHAGNLSIDSEDEFLSNKGTVASKLCQFDNRDEMLNYLFTHVCFDTPLLRTPAGAAQAAIDHFAHEASERAA